MAINLLRWSVTALAAYFFAVSLAHMFQVKVPFLFIYYDVPSTVYQDRIISFLAFGWAMFLFAGAHGVARGLLWPIRYVLLAGAGALAGLVAINLQTDFAALQSGLSAGPYWAQTGAMAVYLLWLGLLYLRAERKR